MVVMETTVIRYGNCVLKWLWIVHSIVETRRMVVSDSSDAWSPNTAPLITAASVGVSEFGAVDIQILEAIGMKIPKQHHALPSANAVMETSKKNTTGNSATGILNLLISDPM